MNESKNTTFPQLPQKHWLEIYTALNVCTKKKSHVNDLTFHLKKLDKGWVRLLIGLGGVLGSFMSA